MRFLLVASLYILNRLKTGGLETPSDSGTLTNFVEIGQARDKILSLKLDQVRGGAVTSTLSYAKGVYRFPGPRRPLGPPALSIPKATLRRSKASY